MEPTLTTPSKKMGYSLDCRRQVVATDVPHVDSLSLTQSVARKRLAMTVETSGSTI